MEHQKHIYFVGIGGIGMSALAQLFAHGGARVVGSDREPSPTTELLERKGIAVHIGQTGEHVTEGTDLLVYSDAVPADNPERARARELGIRELSYFAALGEATREKHTVVVAGTHGKTTTTGMLARILRDNDVKPTAVIGSIVRDFESNFLAGESDWYVVEGCEYRDHLLELTPQILVITNIEYDHTDYFPSFEALQKTFRKVAEGVPESGVIVTDSTNPNIAPVLEHVRAQVVDYTHEQVPELRLIGEFNAMNARAAKAAAKAVRPDISEGGVDAALKDFHGSWRRFEYKGKTESGADVYDDYAHHPTAIEKTLYAAREQFPGKRIVVAFHPHLYSRTRDLFDGFVRALALADSVIVAPVYAAREAHDPSVSNHMLAKAVQEKGGEATGFDTFDEVAEQLKKEPADSLIITMGAGDIYKVAEDIVTRKDI